jgi:hypothetical protein
VEFPESNSNFFQDCREVGDIPGSVKDGTKEFGLEGLAEQFDAVCPSRL